MQSKRANFKSLTEPTVIDPDMGVRRQHGDENKPKNPWMRSAEAVFSRLHRFGLALIPFLFFVISGFLSISSLAAHHFQHTIRDVQLNDANAVLTVAGLKVFSERINGATTEYTHNVRAISSGSQLIKEADAMLSEYWNRESTDQNSNRATSTPPSSTTQPAEQDSADGIQSPPQSYLAAFRAACEVSQIARRAENIRQIRTFQTVEDTPFAIIKDRDIPLTEASVLRRFSKYDRFTTSGIANHQLECDRDDISLLDKRWTMVPQMEEPWQTYRYFTGSKADSSKTASDTNKSTFLGTLFAPVANFSPGSVYINLIHSPRQIQTVLLVIFMGTLGASINLVRLFLAGNNRAKLSHYIFLPMMGGVAAFAIYVVAKSGVVLIADTGAGDDSTYLSPYFVSFLGLVSGLLSQEAFDSIYSVGRRIFNETGDSIERWYIGDVAVANEASTIGPVATLIDVPESTVKAWLTGKRSIPHQAQIIIAGQLGKLRREIFTDLPPSRGDEPVAPSAPNEDDTAEPPATT